MSTRRKARECALQMLFQWDVTHDTIDRVASTFWDDQEESDETRAFAESLASGAVDNVEKIDACISRHAENWRLDRMAIVDRNILRMATWEFLSHAGTPNTVIINEAIEIARRFSAQESPQFINGILDSIRKEIEKPE